MSEPARAPRYDATLIVSLRDRGRVWGTTRNLSVSGMLLDVSWQPPVHTELDISMRWCADDYGCRVKVVRHAIEGGVAVAYLDPIDAFRNAVASVVSSCEASAVG